MALNNNENKRVVLYFMRHGQTIINKAGRVQGWCDGVLTDEGIEVAESVALGLRDIEFKGVYSSDLGRAVKTARIVAKENIASENLQVKEVQDLREAFFGKYEGELEKILFSDILNYLNVETFEEAVKTYPDFGRAYADTCAALDETGAAENFETLITRVKRGVMNIIDDVLASGGGNALLVVHGGMIRSILKELDPDVVIDRMDNSCVNVVEYNDGKFKVLSVNDFSYKEKGEKIKNS